jgi:hypothetical protein
MRHLVTASVLCNLFLAAAPFQAATVPGNPPPVAAKFLDLFDRLRVAQEKGEQGKFQLVTFQLSEAEINEYMVYSLKTTPRPGLDSITVKIFGQDYVSTLTRVDFDALERWRPGTIPKLLQPLLKGKKSISVDYRIHVDDSKLTFTVEKASYETQTLPSIFVDKLIQIVAARQPEKYDTTKPIPLPFGLRKVWTAEHTVQGRN